MDEWEWVDPEGWKNVGPGKGKGKEEAFQTQGSSNWSDLGECSKAAERERSAKDMSKG